MEYHKIQTVFKRDRANKNKTLLEGEWTLPEFEYLANNEWVFTEKVDGTNIRVMYKNGRILFAGRTDNSNMPTPLVNRLEDLFADGVERFQRVFGDSTVCLYGEGYGDRIQKGRKYRPDQDFVLFDVLVDGWWLRREDVDDVARKFNLDSVPVVGTGTLYDMVENAKNGIQSTWGDFQAEGYVARPRVELKTRGGERIITKIKCRDFPK